MLNDNVSGYLKHHRVFISDYFLFSFLFSFSSLFHISSEFCVSNQPYPLGRNYAMAAAIYYIYKYKWKLRDWNDSRVPETALRDQLRSVTYINIYACAPPIDIGGHARVIDPLILQCLWLPYVDTVARVAWVTLRDSAHNTLDIWSRTDCPWFPGYWSWGIVRISSLLRHCQLLTSAHVTHHTPKCLAAHTTRVPR